MITTRAGPASSSLDAAIERGWGREYEDQKFFASRPTKKKMCQKLEHSSSPCSISLGGQDD
jgi:hypothetical protein